MMTMDDAWWIETVEQQTSFDERIISASDERRLRPSEKVKRFLISCVDTIDSTCSKLCPSQSSLCWVLDEGMVYRDHAVIGSPLAKDLESVQFSTSQGKVHDIKGRAFTTDEDDYLDEDEEMEVTLNPYHSRPTPPPKERMAFRNGENVESLGWSCSRVLFHQKSTCEKGNFSPM
jgi:hypothetical protein